MKFFYRQFWIHLIAHKMSHGMVGECGDNLLTLCTDGMDIEILHHSLHNSKREANLYTIAVSILPV